MKMNILYIHSHDTGRYVQPYGHAAPTPNLQKLAEQGVLFRQCFTPGPTCSPSRAALLTGQSPHSCGMTGLAHRGFSMTDYSRHLCHTLKAAGYTTALAGVQHVTAHDRLDVLGYDAILGNQKEAEKAAVGFLDNAPERPFFLSVGFGETHRRFPEPDPDISPDYCAPPSTVPDTPETRRDMAGFKTMARQLDRKMGVVFEALDRNGLSDDTLVICTTDHGIAFPRIKCNLTDPGIGVMLIVRGPGGFDGGKAIDALVSHVDLFPTICELTGIDKPDWLEGTSIMPLIRGEAAEINEQIFSEVTWHASYEPMRCIRTKRFKYIRRFSDRVRPVLPNCDDSPSKTVWMDAGWANVPNDTEALYNLVFDPGETNNLAGCGGMAPVLEDLRRRLEAWMQRTNDPLLRGPIGAPKGARYNDPDGLSPNEPPLVAQ